MIIDFFRIFKSLICTFGAVIYSIIISELFPNLIYLITQYESLRPFDKVIITPLYIFMVLFFLLLLISLIIKAIQEIISFFYYAFFYNNKYDKMEIKIDQNNIIKESFIQFKNGDILPITISKIVTNVPVTINEEKEENKNE